jgi:hypothetical protein
LVRHIPDFWRRSVAMLCMALAVMLSGQTYISLMDRIDHAHHHQHFANPLAGDVQFCGSDHDGCGLHHHHGHDHGNAAPSHGDSENHQHGDAGLVFLAAQSFVLPPCPLIQLACDASPADLATVNPGGLERPPKTVLELRT